MNRGRGRFPEPPPPASLPGRRSPAGAARVRRIGGPGDLGSQAGTYAIIFRCSGSERIAVGRLGGWEFGNGYHVYVGSAFGPGGIRARVLRHHRGEKARHWHIDYLRDRMCFIEAWYSHDFERREHLWAGVMSSLNFPQHLKGFGSSDCDCFSHLFYAATRPRLSIFRRAVMRQVPGHEEIAAWTPMSQRRPMQRG